MKRYRVLSMDFDTRADIYTLGIRDDWEPKIKELWRENQKDIEEQITYEFGQLGAQQKIVDFVWVGTVPFSVLAFHNKFLRQIRSAFIAGGYYPALIGACALGERILNHLILALRDDFTSTPEYKRVARKDSFDDWDDAIEVLSNWSVLLPKVQSEFRKLKDLRNRTIHFRIEADTNERELALKSIEHLTEIAAQQFGAFGTQPWFIEGVLGASFIKKEWESNPFVSRIYLPNCHLVGPSHEMQLFDNSWVVHDQEYEDMEITDDEFRDLWNSEMSSSESS